VVHDEPIEKTARAIDQLYGSQLATLLNRCAEITPLVKKRLALLANAPSPHPAGGLFGGRNLATRTDFKQEKLATFSVESVPDPVSLPIRWEFSATSHGFDLHKSPSWLTITGLGHYIVDQSTHQEQLGKKMTITLASTSAGLEVSVNTSRKQVRGDWDVSQTMLKLMISWGQLASGEYRPQSVAGLTSQQSSDYDREQDWLGTLNTVLRHLQTALQ
jgi:hypothetical protein